MTITTVLAELPPATDLVRPYAITGGRTRSQLRLAPEALAITTDTALSHPDLLPELQIITLLCRTPTAIVEIAAALGHPLGVAEVLVADLAERGLLSLITPAHAPGGHPPHATLQRVLRGLIAL